MKPALLILLLAFCTSAFAQKKELIQDKKAIQERADAELDAAMAPGGPLYTVIQENGLKGKMDAQISFREKGDVSSVFVVAFDGSIEDQNRFRSALHAFRFHFKMPKGQQYRIEKHFDLNP
ncbi:MAG: hypothetical protein R2818_12215 [Flavobacteriales bacterium]